nr:uncharacterized protein LOC109180246 [Ipomoea trifida]
MADRRTSHQAHLKSQASTTDPAPVISSSIHGTEIPIDSAYLDSVVNLAALARMYRIPVPALSDVAQGVTVILEEEDQSAALQLNCRRHENPDRTTPTRLTEGETVRVPQSDSRLTRLFSFFALCLPCDHMHP